MIAQKRGKFDMAEQWYMKALSTIRSVGHPSLMVNPLAQLGLLRCDQERLPESVVWLGKALTIAVEYQMRVAAQILLNLADLMKSMGENEFVAVWQQSFGEKPPLDLLRKAMKQL